MGFVEINILCKPSMAEIVIAEISDHCQGFVETEEGMVAYAEAQNYKTGPLATILEKHQKRKGIQYKTREVEEQNWNAIWEKSFQPVVVDQKCRIRASFHPYSDAIPYDIVINPKMSFGTGHHETTSSMMSLLMEMEVEGKKVLDVGCGTGILTILAEKLGAKYLEAIDIEEMAVENSRENFRLNQTSLPILYSGTIKNVHTKDFDIILANLTKKDIVKELKAYVELLTNRGALIVSGFYEDDVPEVIKEAELAGFRFLKKVSKNDWAACVYQCHSKN